MSPPDQAPRAPSATRRWGMIALKTGLLVVAFALVWQQIEWHDHVETADGRALAGTITEGFEPDARAVVIRRPDGESVRLDEGAWKPDSRRFGVRTSFGRLDLGWYLLGMSALLTMYALGAERWRRLLVAQGIRATYGRAFRLTFMGSFWNNFMPGMTGGDVAKAWMIARRSPGRRSEAVATVIVDRIIGLVVLAAISAAAILWNFDRFAEIGLIIFAILAGITAAAIVLLSRRLRRLLRFDQVLRSLPRSDVLMRLDQAFRLYRGEPRVIGIAVALSLAAHFCNIATVWIFGRDLEIGAGWDVYLAAVPIVLITASVPLFPGGWGVRETAFIVAFRAVGVDQAYESRVFILSVLLGVSLLVWSLLGGVFLFVGDEKGLRPPTVEDLDPAR